MTDIVIGLVIKDEINQSPMSLGVAIAAEMGDPIQAHLEAYGFTPNHQGATSLLSFLRDICRSLEIELGLAPGDMVPIISPGTRLDGHNLLDAQCVEHVKGGPVSGAARCPVCRPIRPSFNPQPKGPVKQ